MLPPRRAELRSCGDAAFHSDSVSAGQTLRSAASSATSAMRASAPKRKRRSPI